jgi:dTDP-4-amino-4,6-dideoxygalactose transaminase
MPVPFFDSPAVFRERENHFGDVFREAGRRVAFVKQKHLQEFESSLASFLDARHVLGVGNATDGLEVALRAAGVGPRDEVILSSHTMLTTATAIHFAGATPVPGERGSEHLIDPAAAEVYMLRKRR